MCEQHTMNFNGATIRAINIYRTAAASEKFIDGVQAKLTPSQKEALRRICAENRLDMSSLVRDALTFYIDLWPYKGKIERHHRVLRKLLDSLS